ncbi:MAG TPA: hypothetical protein VMJ10_00285 [Kofleriaceae bacterium]|nr:hypothetical protein [Kofleriaceae bacterium]
MTGSPLSRLVFALVVVTCAYFVQGGGDNENSRYALVRSIVERGTFRIDAYRRSTLDIATFDGHWYSDKSPGFSFVAAAPYALGARIAQPSDDVDPQPFALHLVTLATCGLAAAFAAVALLDVLVRLGVSRVAALLAVLGWIFGTNAFAYATMFYSHQFAASLLVLAFAALHRELPAAAGFATGVAVISELTVAPLALLVAAFALSKLGWRCALRFAVASLPPVVVLALYNASCFGSPLHVGYQSLADPYFEQGMSHLFGFGAPNVEVMGMMLASQFRGLLPVSPFLVLAVPGWYVMLRARQTRVLGAACVLGFVGMLVLLSGYAFWWGGSSFGSRHFVPALPLLVIPVAFAIDRMRRSWLRGVAIALVAASIAICTVCVGIQPELFDAHMKKGPAPELPIADPRQPLSDTIWPLFRLGYVSNKATFHSRFKYAANEPGHDADAYNLGELLGLDGTNSFLPLVAIWAAFGFAIVRRLRIMAASEPAAR